jgi:RNA polymerase sigma factor (sigma-70 family)
VPLYRFAFLMTGSAEAATAVFDQTVERAASHFSDIRCPRRAARWLFAQARANCRRYMKGRSRAKASARGAGKNGAQAPESSDRSSVLPDDERAAEISAAQVAAAFAPLPEPERCALALFYLLLFPASELADVLGIRPSELPALLNRGRALLRGHPAMAGLTTTETDLARC